MTITHGHDTWMRVCAARELTADRGVAVLVDGHPVALFLLAPTTSCPSSLHAVDHIDPATGFAVMARGLVGSVGDRSFVASPLHKQRYDLETGACLDDPDLRLNTWPVRIVDGAVEVGREAINSST